MKKINRYILCAIMGLLALTACKKNDYINDGGKANAHVNMTTYDFLKSRPQFDSLVRIIDKAGMKDEINGNITFFATTNYGIVDYVKAKKQLKIIEVGDENINFGIKDLNAAELRDSLKIYMYKGAINRAQMTTEGTLYDSMLGAIPNVKFMIRLRRTLDYGGYVDYVDYVNFTKVIGTRDDKEADQASIPQNQKDISYDCQTSGIITTTGILHVLSDNQRLFFNGESLGN
ncbi:hypothetical protein [Mucilaginibacter gynuensis]